MADNDIEIRLVRLETIIGDKDSGLVSDIHGIKSSLESLKQFQWKLFGGIAVVMFFVQALFKLSFK